jgi:TRAP-type C4-dicarboxylate transport system substrate-binding protein
MMRAGTRSHAAITTLAAVALAAFAGCSGSGSDKAGGRASRAPVILTLADEPGAHGDVAEWAHTVEKLSHGSIRIDVTSRGTKKEIYYDQHRIAAVRQGQFDIAKIGARTWDTVGVTDFQALMAPFLIDSLPLEQRVLETRIPGTMLKHVAPLGLVGIALLPGELQQPLGVTRPLLKPTDFEGATIAIRPSRVEAATFRALGGFGKPAVPAGPIAQFDGAELNLAQIDEQRYETQARWLTVNVALWPHVMTLVMNRRAFDALSPGQRAILRRAAAVALPTEMSALRTEQIGGASSLCGRGLSFLRASPADRVVLRAAVQPVYDKLKRDPETRAYIHTIALLKKQTTAEAAPRCSTTGRSVVRSAPSQLVGSWETTISLGEFAAAHPNPKESPAANWGHYTLTFNTNGRFETWNSRFPAQPSGLGTYVVRGDVILLVPGGTVSMGAGETWRYIWNRYRDTLTFKRVGKGPSPTGFVVKPWRRVR